MKRLLTICLLLLQGSLFAQTYELPVKWKEYFADRNFSRFYVTEEYLLEEGTAYETLLLFADGTAAETSLTFPGMKYMLLSLDSHDELQTTDGVILKSKLQALVVNNYYFKKVNDRWHWFSVEGPISVFTFLDEGTMVTAIHNTRQKDMLEMATLALGYKKKMMKLLGDYTELSDKIAAKEKGYKFLDGKTNEVVHEYNLWVKENDPDWYNQHLLQVN